MKTLRSMKVVLLPLMILATTMGSSIASQMPPRDRNILEENISCRSENQKEEREGSQVSPTGRSITEALTNLNETLKRMEEILSKEKSSLSTQLLEK